MPSAESYAMAWFLLRTVPGSTTPRNLHNAYVADMTRAGAPCMNSTLFGMFVKRHTSKYGRCYPFSVRPRRTPG